MTPTPTARVALLALASRLLVLGGMLLASRAFVKLDTSARFQARPCNGTAAAAVPPAPAAGGPPPRAPALAVWDTLHFARIARCGYETDMLAAFFPLVPGVMAGWRGAAGLLHWAGAAAGEEALPVLGAAATNLAAFCAAAVLLHKLSLRELGNPALADLSTLLFCLNPASPFYSAAYSEALYAAASFLGLWLLPTHHWAAVAAFAVASTSRSNGMLNCWFMVHALLRRWRLRGRLLWQDAGRTVLGCLLVLAPYACMQAYGYWTFCRTPLLPPPAWCSRRVPSLYADIQRHYWGVGFLQFYRDPARLPMIAAALPVAYLSLRGCWQYLAADPLRTLTLGLFRTGDPALPPWLAAVVPALQAPGAVLRAGPSGAAAVAARRSDAGHCPQGFFFSPAVAPYIYHWALLTAVALLVMNVHVATRFLSACPALYWYAAHYIGAEEKGGSGDGSRWRARWVWGWAGVYTALGCLLFPNHYPWT